MSRGLALPIHHQCESEGDRDAVDTEWNEGACPDKCEQKFDAEQGDKERSSEAGGEYTKLLRRERGSIPKQVVASGSKHCRHGEKERELHYRSAT